MTNKEKAREIARECVYCFADAENGALKMAEWKDHQFKEYLAKKKEGLFNSNCLSVEPYIDFIDEIINELFEEIEQDNSDNGE